MATGLPTLAKTWQYTVNQAQAAQGTGLADNRLILINIKTALLGFASAPFTMDYSCNSTTAGTKGDGVDRIGSTLTNIVTSTGAHSWWVLKNATSGVEICFDCNQSGASLQSMTIVFSFSAGFTGGTTTARPTATDERVLVSGGSWNNGNTADLAYRWSVELSTDGQSCRIFNFAAGTLMFSAGYDFPTDVVTGWTNACVAWWLGTTPSLASFTTANSFASRIGSTSAVGNLTCEILLSSAGPSEPTVGNIANEVDGNWPFWPCGYMSTTVGVRGRHARMQDLWFGSVSIPAGDSYPATGTTGQFAQIGNIIVPWNGGAVNTS